MARQARKHSMLGIYHIIIRGVNRQNIFEDHEDRDRFIKTIYYYKSISQYEVFAYCLMGNHVHLLIKETAEPISIIMKRILGSYSIWYNNKYDRSGHLFQERFKSEPVNDNGYFRIALRYIHQNPVKAGLVQKIEDWKWCSYNEYFRKAIVINTDFALNLFSEDKAEALKRFRSYLNETDTNNCLEYQEKYKLTDDKIISYLSTLGIKNITELQQSEKVTRDDVIRKIKSLRGITLRQLSRITGISKSVLGRI